MILRSVGILSVGKIAAAMYAFFGLLGGAIFSLMSLAGAAMGGRGGIAPILFGVGAIVILPLVYGTIGFIVGVLSALIYNLLASAVGGIQMEFERDYVRDTEADDER